jgi:3-hydroxyacyl-CoA dehydrogenase / enoyl-CoA hydratase / 3-hydroxybutyryl-CoA epimerase
VTAAQAAVADRSERRIFSIEVRRDGIAIVTIDDAREAGNAITTAFQAELLAAIARIEEDATVAAAVLTSGKPSGFVNGVSAALLTSIKFATDAERFATELSHALRKLEGLRKPVVAAVHGPALGAGFEVALACHAIVASDDPGTMLGLPQARMGMMPAGNGVLRMANRAGLRVAIEVAVGGEALRASAALALDLVDDVCPRAILLDAAARHAKALVGHVPRVRDARGDLRTLALEKNPVGRRFLFKQAREKARATASEHSAAPALILDVLERFADKGFDEAARLEAKAFGDLVVSETAHRLVELSQATAALDRDSGVDEKAEPRLVRRVAVLGGGVMGRGIAYVTAASGVSVRLKESDDAAVGRALRGVKVLLDERVRAQTLTALEADQVFSRLSTTTDFSGLRNVDAVIEAVPEDLALKQETLREVETRIDPKCVYASNTSSISISRIAQAATHPERVLGVRYFNPVATTALLEVVRADKTAAWAVATAVAIGKRQRKTVIVVKDGPGFYTTRILAPLLNEALQLVSEGVAATAIDDAVVEWGFSVGPIQLLDDTGIDVQARIAEGLHGAFGARMTSPGALATLVADDRRGRSNGRGIYRYGSKMPSARRTIDPGAYELLGVEPKKKLPVEEIQLRCALAMVNEAVRCVGDGVLRDPRDGDVGAIFGAGFPRFRGGPFRYVDTIGAGDVHRRIQNYADRFGDRWRPAPLLVQMAKKGERFFA